MIGIIVELVISWLLLWLFQKKNLGVLGFRPTGRRPGDFAIFFFITAGFCVMGFLLRMYFAKERWQVNPALDFNLIASGFWWHLKSVLYEELIFRGAILYILIKRLGSLPGIIISAIAFGIYHWFSFGIIGNAQQMIITFLTTGIVGLLWAYSFAKTYSLYIAIGMHLAWNFTNFIFSSGSNGNGAFVPVKPVPVVQVSWFVYFVVVFLPILSMLLINLLLVKRKEQVVLPL